MHPRRRNSPLLLGFLRSPIRSTFALDSDWQGPHSNRYFNLTEPKLGICRCSKVANMWAL